MAHLSCIMDRDMDLVYICRDGENEELRYSIRSAVKNLPHDKIWVVGGKPDWYTGNHISVNQTKDKYQNAKENLKVITKSEEISESFILMNDDFYIINKVNTIPYMHAKTLDDKIKSRDDQFSGNSYMNILRKTLHILSKKSTTPPLDYELHVPMVMEKKKLSLILRFGGLWRSVYGNTFNVGGIEMTDVKVYEESSVFYPSSYDMNDLKYDYLSSNDGSFEDVKKIILDKRFSSKSIYEA
jgi:hypothetical protein